VVSVNPGVESPPTINALDKRQRELSVCAMLLR
jgi:hypothetical protein